MDSSPISLGRNSSRRSQGAGSVRTGNAGSSPASTARTFSTEIRVRSVRSSTVRRPDVGKHDDVRGGEQVGVDPGLLFEDIEAGAVDSSITQRRGEGGLVDHGSAAHVHQDRFRVSSSRWSARSSGVESTRSGSWSAPRHRRSGDLLRE